MPDRVQLLLAKRGYPEAVFASALKEDCSNLRERVAQFFEKSMITTPLRLEYQDCAELAKIYRWSRVDEVRYEQDGIHLKITSTPDNLERIRARLPMGPEPMLEGNP